MTPPVAVAHDMETIRASHVDRSIPRYHGGMIQIKEKSEDDILRRELETLDTEFLIGNAPEPHRDAVRSMAGSWMPNYTQHCDEQRRRTEEEDRMFLSDRETQQAFLRKMGIQDRRVGKTNVRDIPLLMPAMVCANCRACRSMAELRCGACQAPRHYTVALFVGPNGGP